MRRRGCCRGEREGRGGNGRRGGCEAQHSVHTNSTVSKSGAAPLPDEGRGGSELGPDREVVREGGRWTEDLKMNGEWEKCREKEGKYSKRVKRIHVRRLDRQRVR